MLEVQSPSVRMVVLRADVTMASLIAVGNANRARALGNIEHDAGNVGFHGIFSW